MWVKSLPADERLALDRCLAALSGALAPPVVDSSGPKPSRGSGVSAPTSPKSIMGAAGGRPRSSGPIQGTRVELPRERERRSSRGSRAEGATQHPAGARRRGVCAILASLREPRDSKKAAASVGVGPVGDSDALGGTRRNSRGKRPRGEEGEVCDGPEEAPASPARKVARTSSGSAQPNHDDTRLPLSDGRQNAPIKATETISEGGNGAGKGEGGVSMPGPGGEGHDAGERERVGHGPGNEDSAPMQGEEARGEGEGEDLLTVDMRKRLMSVAEKVASAAAPGSTSKDVQAAAAAAVSLLEDSVSPGAQRARDQLVPTRNWGGHLQPPQALEVVCRGLGLEKPSSGDGSTGCSDDLVLAVSSGFVTPALSLRHCLSFVSAVFVPRARSLSSPASRLLVTAVSDVGKARPGAVIDGLILPLMCDGDPAELGSAQCELCTRLIKQVTPVALRGTSELASPPVSERGPF